MIKILFVCHGNICRSPMGEYILKDMVKKLGIADKFYIASAAAHRDEIGSPVYPPARRKLGEMGISCKDKRAILLTREDYYKYDLLLGADYYNIRDMKRICGGDPEDKIRLVLDFTDHPRDIADPWYTDDFDATADDIVRGCNGLLNYLKREKLI